MQKVKHKSFDNWSIYTELKKTRLCVRLAVMVVKLIIYIPTCPMSILERLEIWYISNLSIIT